MAVDFLIPKLEETTEVTIVNWLVEDGAVVNEGDEIIEVETDKAVVPVPATAAGVLHIGSYKAGDVVSTETVLATIEPTNGAPAPAKEISEETMAPKAAVQPTSSQEESGPKATPVAQKMAADLGVDLKTVTGSGNQGKITKADVQQATWSPYHYQGRCTTSHAGRRRH
jgi:pyruvate/2-oxoglutarate dehydrogenase complex dihydrolipoamide acyltransferase (E2) component